MAIVGYVYRVRAYSKSGQQIVETFKSLTPTEYEYAEARAEMERQATDEIRHVEGVDADTPLEVIGWLPVAVPDED